MIQTTRHMMAYLQNRGFLRIVNGGWCNQFIEIDLETSSTHPRNGIQRVRHTIYSPIPDRSKIRHITFSRLAIIGSLGSIGKYWLDTIRKRAEEIQKEKVEKYDNI